MTHRNTLDQFVKMMRADYVNIDPAPHHRSTHGTTATAHDLFYNLPVRRQGLIASLELERLRHELACIALSHPLIAISLVNDATGVLILQTHRSVDMRGTFTQLFGSQKAKALRNVSTSFGSYAISGLFSVEPNTSSNLQV